MFLQSLDRLHVKKYAKGGMAHGPYLYVEGYHHHRQITNERIYFFVGVICRNLMKVLPAVYQTGTCGGVREQKGNDL